MKKIWEEPKLKVLNVNLTMAGPGIRDVDESYEDEDEQGFLHHS
ncbi:paeninodin family lasso peptide [Rossellomorea vietnamensis]|nr:paeninodin family lasso peptide [Rossellomorea vietnamensis]